MQRSQIKKLVGLLLALGIASMAAACTNVAPGTSGAATDQTPPPPQAEAEAEEPAGYAPTFSQAELDDSWSKENATLITLEGNTATVEGEGAAAVEGGVKISAAGTYVLAGTLEDGRVVAEIDSDEPLRLVLNGVRIACATSAPLYLANGDVILILAEGTQNELMDGSAYQYADSTVKEPNACLYADDNLTIIGKGELTVNGNFNNGIGSKDELKIAAGAVTVKAPNNGLKGNDCVLINGGDIHIDSTDDGIKSDNTKDAGRGVISVEAGAVGIVCGDDALQATHKVSITGGLVTVKAGGKRINCDGAITIAEGCLK